MSTFEIATEVHKGQLDKDVKRLKKLGLSEHELQEQHMPCSRSHRSIIAYI